jgi:ABC-2 type transport system ATP-binding protein
MIEAVNLTKVFGDFIAVNDVSLTVKEGQVLALLGHNGAGKTTTTRMLSAILAPTKGYAKIAGYDTVTQALEVRRSIGHLTELPGLYSRMRIEEYLDFFAEVFNVPKETRRSRAEEMMRQFDLWETRKLKIGEYSKGMRQKTALIRALIHDPKVLFLDEPTSAMDPYSSKLVRDSISQLKKQNRTVVLCTHNLYEAEELADHIAIIRKGEILIEGSPDDLKRRLLGAPSFTVKLAQYQQPDNLPTRLKELVEVSDFGVDWFTYRCEEPEKYNPRLLKILVESGYQVITISETPRSLESVYLKIAGTPATANQNRDESEQTLSKLKEKRKGWFRNRSKEETNKTQETQTEQEEAVR